MAEAAFDRWITMHLSEHYTEQDIDEMAAGIAKVARHFATRGAMACTASGGERDG